MNRHHISRGLAAGFIAAASFAAWFLLVDVVQGQPFFTPAYMSGLIFSYTTALPATARVATFTILHFLAFGLVGVVVSWLLAKRRIEPHIYIGIVVGFLLFAIIFLGSDVAFGVNIVRELGWAQLLAGNVLAGLVMLAYLRAREPAQNQA